MTVSCSAARATAHLSRKAERSSERSWPRRKSLCTIAAMPRLQANGSTFEVVLDGPADAPCLVLYTSIGSTHAMWAQQVDRFARHFRVLRYDTRGHGRS